MFNFRQITNVCARNASKSQITLVSTQYYQHLWRSSLDSIKILTLGKVSSEEMEALPSDMTIRGSSKRKVEGTSPNGGSQSSSPIEASESITTDASRPRVSISSTSRG